MKLKLAAILAVACLMAGPALAQATSANEIVASIGSSQFRKAADKVDGASSARVVKISTFAGAKQAASKLALAETIYERDLDYLHSNLQMSPIALQAIRAAGFDVNSIVLATVDSEGSAILYADDL